MTTDSTAAAEGDQAMPPTPDCDVSKATQSIIRALAPIAKDQRRLAADAGLSEKTVKEAVTHGIATSFASAQRIEWATNGAVTVAMFAAAGALRGYDLYHKTIAFAVLRKSFETGIPVGSLLTKAGIGAGDLRSACLDKRPEATKRRHRIAAAMELFDWTEK